MVDFPSSPADGDRHTENGSSWIYKSPPGIWAVETGDAGTPQTISVSDLDAGWFVVGDILIVIGQGVQGTHPTTHTFPKAFKAGSRPQVSAISELFPASDPVITTANGDATDTGFSLYCNNAAGTQATGQVVHYIAIGAAATADILPQTVQTVGGAELQEFHDPTGAASYRISGSTLECWGLSGSVTSGGLAIGFPKTFKNPPSCQANVNASNPPADQQYVVTVGSATTTNMTIWERWQNVSTGVVGEVPCYWYAIGEWDGVS